MELLPWFEEEDEGSFQQELLAGWILLEGIIQNTRHLLLSGSLLNVPEGGEEPSGRGEDELEDEERGFKV